MKFCVLLFLFLASRASAIPVVSNFIDVCAEWSDMCPENTVYNPTYAMYPCTQDSEDSFYCDDICCTSTLTVVTCSTWLGDCSADTVLNTYNDNFTCDTTTDGDLSCQTVCCAYEYTHPTVTTCLDWGSVDDCPSDHEFQDTNMNSECTSDDNMYDAESCIAICCAPTIDIGH